MKIFIKRILSETDDAFEELNSLARPWSSDHVRDVTIGDYTHAEIAMLRTLPSIVLFDDIQFEPFLVPATGRRYWWQSSNDVRPALEEDPPWTTKTQQDVLGQIKAPAAWQRSKGSGVTIAIVDSGVDGTMKEFPNRSPLSKSFVFTSPWEDSVGHGTMCAGIACGTTVSGGKYSGVAPESTLLCARTDWSASDLYRIYEYLLTEKRKGSFPGGLVVSNSFGLYRCDPPIFPEGHPYIDLVKLCVSEGMVFIFSAGNNHGKALCKFGDDASAPNTIWAANSIDEVITVGTVDWDNSNQKPQSEHANSSRGPGQWSNLLNKPDVVAPTFGDHVWRGGYKIDEWWVTSGACPQVAGLAALLLSIQPNLAPINVKRIIRDSASSTGSPSTCIGAGVINCQAALDSI